jgi:hypothetical protein
MRFSDIQGEITTFYTQWSVFGEAAKRVLILLYINNPPARLEKL